MQCSPLQSVQDGLKLVSECSDETALITDALRRELNLNTTRYDQMFDVGCGYGRFAVAMVPYVRRFILLDPHSEMLTEAARHITALNKPFELHCCRIEDVLSNMDWRFDLILLAHVLYYTPDWRLVLDQCMNWLTPAGRLVVILWSHDSDLFQYSPKTCVGTEEVTSEMVLDHLASLKVNVSSIPIDARMSVSTENERQILARFLGYSSPESIREALRTRLPAHGVLIDRQRLITIHT